MGSLDKKNQTGLADLQEQVITKGLCCFCGTCVSACPSGFISLNYHKEEPQFGDVSPCGSGCRICFNACPGKFLDYPSLEKELFGRSRNSEEWMLGIYQNLYGGFAYQPETRRAGTSGGVGTALLQCALESGLVDISLVASTDPDVPWRGVPFPAANLNELIANARSKYIAVPIVAELQRVTNNYKKVAVTALPCQVAGIRKGQMLGLKAFKQVEIIIGIACGYCAYSDLYRHLISEVLQVDLEQVKEVEFRGGPYPGEFRVYKHDGEMINCPSSVRLTMAFAYIRDRCSMCIDWGAELADLSLSDLFTRQDVDQERVSVSSSALIVRTDRGARLVRTAEQSGLIELSNLDPGELSGNIGLEWKKHGFAGNLERRAKWGWPVPEFGLKGSVSPFARKMHIYNPRSRK